MSLTPITQFTSLPSGASVIISDTALAIQGNWSTLTTNVSKIKSIIINDGGGVALSVLALSSDVVSKMPLLSINVTDKASSLSNLNALSPYGSKIKSFSITGTLSVPYDSFELNLAAKLSTNYRVLNVPASAVSSMPTYASVTVRDYSYNIKSSLSSLRTSISKITGIAKIDGAPISVDAATFLTNGVVFKLVQGTITDTNTNLLTRVSEIDVYASTNRNSIQTIDVPNVNVPYTTFTAIQNVARLFAQTFIVSGVTVGNVNSVLSATFPKATVVISDVLSVVLANKAALQDKRTKIVLINAVNDVDYVINRATYVAFPILNKISYS